MPKIGMNAVNLIVPIVTARPPLYNHSSKVAAESSCPAAPSDPYLQLTLHTAQASILKRLNSLFPTFSVTGPPSLPNLGLSTKASLLETASAGSGSGMGIETISLLGTAEAASGKEIGSETILLLDQVKKLDLS